MGRAAEDRCVEKEFNKERPHTCLGYRTLRYFAHLLNNYANLLPAVLTATYVWLTWRNLKALQRASQREPELRHLDEIKCKVARPENATLHLDRF